MSEELKKVQEERERLEKEIAVKKEKKKIEELKKEASSFEVTEQGVERDHRDLATAAKNGADQDKVIKGINELQERLTRIEASKSAFNTTGMIDMEIVKSLGAEGPELAKKAEDLAYVLPSFQMVSQLIGKPVYHLTAFKAAFGDIGAKGFQKLYSLIEAQQKKVSYNVVKAIKAAVTSGGDVMKALVSASNGWVPTDTNAMLIEHVKKAKASFNALTVFAMPSNPYNWPVSSISGEAKKASENSGPAAADIGTGKMQFDAKKIKRTVEASEELNEDAAFALLPVIFGELVDQVADGLERAVMFGDEDPANTNSNSVGAVPAGTEAYLAIDGLADTAHNGGGDATDQSAATDEAIAVLDEAALLDYRALDPQKMSVVCNPGLYFKLLKTDKVVTLDKIGNNATILSGNLGVIWGMPLYNSNGIPKTDANGKVDAVTPANNTKDSFLVFRKDKAYLGMRRDFATMQDFDVVNETHKLSASVRADYQNAEAASVGFGYNL